jgi:hypothetical protein
MVLSKSCVLTFYNLLFTWCNNGVNTQICTLCPLCIYVFCTISEQTATCALYNTNWLLFITEMKSVYSAVRTGCLNKAVCASSLNGFVFIWEQTATCALYNTNWLLFITEMKSVYSAVRTGSLNKAVCASSFKDLKLLSCFCYVYFNSQECWSLNFISLKALQVCEHNPAVMKYFVWFPVASNTSNLMGCNPTYVPHKYLYKKPCTVVIEGIQRNLSAVEIPTANW